MQAIALDAPGGLVEIEAASWRDLNLVRELERLCFPHDAWPLLDMLGVLTLPHVVRLKAVDGEQVVGFVAGDVRRLQNVAWIATICVHPDWQGRRIGAQLLEECEGQVGVRTVKLSVRASNEAALRLYRRMGYQQTGTWPRYYKGGEDAVVMEKILN
jgi:ribosomal-protein-alanine N-acetyltransferase